MTVIQNDRIRAMRVAGVGYTKIASSLGISENTVKSYCRRNGLTGNVGSLKPENADGEGDSCKQCNKKLDRIPKQKPRKFCSDRCRLAWWGAHKEMLNGKTISTVVCAHCGHEFKTYTPHKYCSHPCYISSRFGKPEGTHDTRAV